MGIKKQANNQLVTVTNGLRTAMVAGSIALISACGSGGGDTQPVDVVKTEIVPLDHMSNIELQRSASIGTKQIQLGMNNVQSFVAQPALSETMNEASAFDLQSLLGRSGESSSSDNDEVAVANDYSSSLWDDVGMEQLINATLGLVGNADVTRDGNSMTIDPDDNELCQQDSLDRQSDVNEMQFCLAMISDLRVRIDGQTEDSGNIRYLFQEETVLQIAYSTNQALYKLRLPGLALVLEKAAQLDPIEFDAAPEVFEGVLELGMRTDTEAAGSEAGALDLKIAAPIVIQDSLTGINLQIATADLLYFEHDNAAGTATFEVNSNAFLYSVTDGEVVEFAGSGSTVKVDLINDGEQISVSKLGLGNGPLTLTIDSVEVMNMTLDTFGFDINSLAQELVLTDGLNFNLMVNLAGSLLGAEQGDESIMMEASATAPANALFSAQPGGSVRLDNAGPLAIDWFLNVDGVSEGASFLLSPGECFTEAGDGNALFSQVVCQ